MAHLKYSYTDVSLVEVPDEVSKVISIVGCPYKCINCHSKHTWTADGYRLDNKHIRKILNEADTDYCSCLLFMGGDWEPNELHDIITGIKRVTNLKIALYTGLNLEDYLKNNDLMRLLSILDYVKFGEYKEELGGLDSKCTNQVMYKLFKGRIVEDITNKFWS